MKYRVLHTFKDKDNDNVLYDVGEEYPKGDYKPTKKRIEELTKKHKEHKVAFIEEVKDEG